MNISDALHLSPQIDLPSKTLINLSYTARFLEERLSGLLKEHGLSTPQFNVLRILRGQKGKPASLSCIQERMVDRNSNTTRLVDKLIKKGWVKRQVCPENRRMVEINITAEGLQVLEILDPLTLANNAQNVANLSDNELITLNTLLDKLKTL